MRKRYLPALIMLTAGAITCIVDIYRKAELLPSLERLLAVLVIFYILGLIASNVIDKTLASKPKKEKPDAGNNEETDNNPDTENNNEKDDKNDGQNGIKNNSNLNGVKSKKTNPVNEKEK